MLDDPEHEWLLWSDTKKLSGFMGMTAYGRLCEATNDCYVVLQLPTSPSNAGC